MQYIYCMISRYEYSTVIVYLYKPNRALANTKTSTHENVVNEGVQVPEIQWQSVSDDRNCKIPQPDRTRINTTAVIAGRLSF